MPPTTSPPPDTISDKILAALLNPHEVDLPDLASRIGISLRELADIASSDSISKTMATFADLFCARAHLIACQFSARTVSALCDASATITPDDRDASPSDKARFLETARKSSNSVIKLAIPEKCLPEYHRNKRLAALAPPMQNPGGHAGATPPSDPHRHTDPAAPSSSRPNPAPALNPDLPPLSPTAPDLMTEAPSAPKADGLSVLPQFTDSPIAPQSNSEHPNLGPAPAHPELLPSTSVPSSLRGNSPSSSRPNLSPNPNPHFPPPSTLARASSP